MEKVKEGEKEEEEKREEGKEPSCLLTSQRGTFREAKAGLLKLTGQAGQMPTLDLL